MTTTENNPLEFDTTQIIAPGEGKITRKALGDWAEQYGFGVDKGRYGYYLTACSGGLAFDSILQKHLNKMTWRMVFDAATRIVGNIVESRQNAPAVDVFTPPPVPAEGIPTGDNGDYTPPEDMANVAAAVPIAAKDAAVHKLPSRIRVRQYRHGRFLRESEEVIVNPNGVVPFAARPGLHGRFVVWQTMNTMCGVHVSRSGKLSNVVTAEDIENA